MAKVFEITDESVIDVNYLKSLRDYIREEYPKMRFLLETKAFKSTEIGIPEIWVWTQTRFPVKVPDKLIARVKIDEVSSFYKEYRSVAKNIAKKLTKLTGKNVILRKYFV